MEGLTDDEKRKREAARAVLERRHNRRIAAKVLLFERYSIGMCQQCDESAPGTAVMFERSRLMVCDSCAMHLCDGLLASMQVGIIRRTKA